jgi:acetyltransferase-like isoleucine patch superfamily enzyme
MSALPNPSFRLGAENNTLIIEEGTDLSGSLSVQFLGSNSTVVIGKNNWFETLRIIASNGSNFSTGEGCSFQSMKAIVYEEGSIRIGTDCMFSHNVELWQTDTHPIFDLKTGERINYSKNIIIENKVWMGTNSVLMGGAYISEGSIVGAHSITSSKFTTKNVIIAGSPARIIRSNVCWEPDELCMRQIKKLTDCVSTRTNRI